MSGRVFFSAIFGSRILVSAKRVNEQVCAEFVTNFVKEAKNGYFLSCGHCCTILRHHNLC